MSVSEKKKDGLVSSMFDAESRKMLSLAFLIFLSGGFVFGFLYRNIRNATLTYEINRLQKVRKRIYLETEDLRLQVAKYSSADRIEKLFREKYGFVPVQISQKISTYILPEVFIKPEKQNKDTASGISDSQFMFEESDTVPEKENPSADEP